MILYLMQKKDRFKKKKLPFAPKKIDADQNKAIANLQKKVKELDQDTEVKWKDTQIDGNVATPVTTCILLNGIAQGTTALLRVGDKVQATSIQFRYNFLTDFDNLNANIVRMIIFWDRQPNGATPLFSDVLDVTTITSAASNTVYAPYNLKNAPRFKILYDKMDVLNVQQSFTEAAGTVTSAIAVASHPRHGKIPLKRIVNYGLGVAGTIADISANALYCLFLSDIGAASQPPVIVSGWRFLFKDA